jgi:hypothetical protein
LAFLDRLLADLEKDEAFYAGAVASRDSRAGADLLDRLERLLD